jgi:GTP-binding protein
MSGLIAIVGRPNVGKSALFNRIARRRIAIVHDQPGVTRDRVSVEAEWEGHPFTLVDTGGIGLLRREKSVDIIARAALDQVQLAIEAAQVIFFMVDAQAGLAPLDVDVAARLRVAGKPVLLVANKADSEKLDLNTSEFNRLGFDRVFPVSAIHGRGMTALMKTALEYLPKHIPEALPEPVAVESVSASVEDLDEETAKKVELKPLTGPIKLAIVGRPNVGKSSIINTLTKSDRLIVSPISGTTRDAVDVPFEVETGGVRQSYVLIDTAGLRKRRRVDDTVEFFSVVRSEESVARCDIAIFVLDAETGILEQDKKIADMIVEHQKACIVVINKWDLMEESVRLAHEEEVERHIRAGKKGASTSQHLTTLAQFGDWVQKKLFFLSYAPVIFTSAKSGLNLDRLLEAVRFVESQLRQKIPTALLNRVLRDAIQFRQPVTSAGIRLKFFYATQIKLSPPTFLLFVNRKDLLSPAYEKYLSVEMRKAFGYEGCPVIWFPRERRRVVLEKVAPKRVKKSFKRKR